jgi:hypothetical protein
MPRRYRTLALGWTLFVSGATLHAQEALLGGVSGGAAAAWTRWTFAEPIPQGTLSIRGVSQVALPVSVRFRMGRSWSLEAGGAVATGTVQVDSGNQRTSLSLSGLTDLKVRLSRSIGSGRTLLTAGVNLPTGTTGLDGNQTTALQALAAPGLQMPVSALGLGPGATLGLIRAMEAGNWAFALGTSVEMRTEYTAVELALASGASRTTIRPGTALHLTFGGDRSIGDHRFGFQFLADAYTQDEVVVGLATGTTVGADYSLGPQFSAMAHLDLNAERWRTAALGVAIRHRTPFTDGNDQTVAGSAGTYVDASFGGVRGGPTGSGFILAADARYHTGLPFTDALVGAKSLVAGITIGAEVPASPRAAWRFTARPQYGTFDTGRANSSGMGLAVSIGYAARTGVR